MPQIPYQPSQTSLPSGGASASGLRVPQNTGAGLQALGNDVLNLSGLAPWFLHAERQRQAAAAQIDALNQHIGADDLLLRTRSELQANLSNYSDQLSSQAQTGQPSIGWTVKTVNENGEEELLHPHDAAMKLAQDTFTKTVRQAHTLYGPSAAASVAGQLEKDVFSAMSAYEDRNLKLRISSGMAGLDKNLNALTADAATNPGESIARINGSIDQAAKHGFFATPKDVEDTRQKYTNAAAMTYWQTKAQTEPESVYSLTKPPEYVTGEQFVKLQDQAYGRITQTQTMQDRKEKALEEMRKGDLDQKQSSLTSLAYQKDISGELESRRVELMDRYEPLKKLNQELIHSRDQDRTDADKRQSRDVRLTLMIEAKKAKFTGDFVAINEGLVAEKVVKGALLPEDGEAVVNAITEARTYQNTADSEANRAISKAHETLKANFFVPAVETKYGSQVKDLEAQAISRFYNELQRDPKQDPFVLQAEVMSTYRPLLAQSKGLATEDLTEQMRGAMKQFPREMFVPGTFKLDEAKAEAAIRTGALSRAAVKEYKSLFETRAQMIDDEPTPQAPTSTAPTTPPASARGKGGFFGRGD